MSYDRPEPRTAAEARERAAAAIAWRREQFRRPVLVVEAPPPAPPPPPRVVRPAIDPSPVAPPMAAEIVAPPPDPEVLDVPSAFVREVVREAETYFKIPARDLLSDKRCQPLVQQRHIMMYVAVMTTGRGLPYIGSVMGRDHTTVLHAYRKVEERMIAGDSWTRKAVEAIGRSLGIPIKIPLAQTRPRIPRESRNKWQPWDEDDICCLMRLYCDQKKSVVYVADVLGRSRRDVYKQTRQLGILRTRRA